MKTLDIQAKEWFDSVNGNSYFSGIVTIDFGLDTEQTFKMPFQYGYEQAYEQEATQLLVKAGLVPENTALWRWCRQNDVVLNSNIQRRQNKSVVKQFGL